MLPLWLTIGFLLFSTAALVGLLVYLIVRIRRHHRSVSGLSAAVLASLRASGEAAEVPTGVVGGAGPPLDRQP